MSESIVSESIEVTLEKQRQAPVTLAGLLAGAADDALRQSPAPGKWSAVAIVAHLAEDELSSSWRYRQMLELPGIDLSAFDQDEWARRGAYEWWDLREALEMYRLLREANVRLLARLTAEELQRWGTHAERGRMTVGELAGHMVVHDTLHFVQIKAALGT